jgi:hypothetical protein
VADDARPAIPASHLHDHSYATDFDSLCFVDVEHAFAQETDLDAVTAAWDGFL